MLTIGDLARTTGVSRRMLRHWEAEGLLTPAVVDPGTGYRRYEAAQAGRVHAIAALRSTGFSLVAIGDLLDPGLTTARLLGTLREREHELVGRIADDETALAQVRARLRSIEEGLLMTRHTLQLHPLPALRLAGLRADVADETEIGHAVRTLDAALRERAPGTPAVVVRTYDPAPDDGPITVGVAIEIDDGDPPAGLDLTVVPALDRGASIVYDGAVANEGDAWLALDAALEPHGLVTAGPYRVRVTAGTTTLEVGVVEAGCG